MEYTLITDNKRAVEWANKVGLLDVDWNNVDESTPDITLEFDYYYDPPAPEVGIMTGAFDLFDFAYICNHGKSWELDITERDLPQWLRDELVNTIKEES